MTERSYLKRCLGMKKSSMVIVTVLVGCSLTVGALGIMRLSNIIENDNTVGLPITLQLLSTTITPGGDLPDYTPGEVLQGLKYDMRLTYTTTDAIDQGTIIVRFDKVGISPSDVVMAWTDAIVWSGMVWTDGGDYLTGILGYVGSQPANEVVSYYATLEYTTPGSYTFQVWVDGIMV